MLIEGTKNTPSVLIEKGLLEIKGRSIPEDAYEFYAPVLNEIQAGLQLTFGQTEIRFHLEYINSGSKKYISNILGVLDKLYLSGKDMVIYWHFDYDDDSMCELGNDFRNMLQIPFHVIEVN